MAPTVADSLVIPIRDLCQNRQADSAVTALRLLYSGLTGGHYQLVLTELRMLVNYQPLALGVSYARHFAKVLWYCSELDTEDKDTIFLLFLCVFTGASRRELVLPLLRRIAHDLPGANANERAKTARIIYERNKWAKHFVSDILESVASEQHAFALIRRACVGGQNVCIEAFCATISTETDGLLFARLVDEGFENWADILVYWFDLVVQLRFAHSIARAFSSALQARLDATSPSFNWMIGNICSNVMRALSAGTEAGPQGDIRGMLEVCTAIYIIAPSRDDVAACAKLALSAIVSIKCSSNLWPDYTFWLAEAMPKCSFWRPVWQSFVSNAIAGGNKYVSIVVDAWKVAPLELFDCKLLKILDTAKPEFLVPNGLSSLELLLQTLKLACGNSGQFSDEQLVYSALSQLVRARYNSADAVVRAFCTGATWNVLLDAFACCVALCASKNTLKSVGFFSDYTLSAGWIRLGNSIDHRSLIYSLYMRLLDLRVPALTGAQLPLVLAIAALEFHDRTNTNNVASALVPLISIVPLSTHDRNLLAEFCLTLCASHMSVDEVKSLAKQISAMVDRCLDEILRDTPNSAYLLFVWRMHPTQQPWLPKLVRATCMCTADLTVHMLEAACRTLHANSNVDAADAIIDRYLTLLQPSLLEHAVVEAVCASDTQTALFMLQRLTAVVISKQDAIVSQRSGALLSALWRAVPPAALHTYLTQLLGWLVTETDLSEKPYAVFVLYVLDCALGRVHEMEAYMAHMCCVALQLATGLSFEVCLPALPENVALRNDPCVLRVLSMTPRPNATLTAMRICHLWGGAPPDALEYLRMCSSDADWQLMTQMCTPCVINAAIV